VDAEGGEAVRDGHGLHVWLWGLPTLAAAQRRRHARGNQGGCYPSLLEGERAAREPGPGHAAGPTLSPNSSPGQREAPGNGLLHGAPAPLVDPRQAGRNAPLLFDASPRAIGPTACAAYFMTARRFSSIHLLACAGE